MRKSVQLRKSQAEALLEEYSSIGLQDTYHGQFICDMITRLGRGKGLSKRQREWLDSLIETGAPEIKGDTQLLERINTAAELDGMQHRSRTLRDFASRIVRGYSLSEKQQRFLDSMLAEAKKIEKDGKYRPENIAQLDIAIQLLNGKNNWYWQHRHGTEKAYCQVREWLRWQREDSVRKDITKQTGKQFELIAEPHIEEWSVNKVLKAGKKGLEQLLHPRHPIGELRYVHVKGTSKPGMPTDVPYVENSSVVQDILIDGTVRTVPVESIRKRR